LDSLPPSKLVMDDWKRTYSNSEVRPVSVPWFWEHYDPTGYSLWIAEHKFPEENEKTFKTCNLVGGWLQRLDPLRKYGFGSVIIFGDEPRLEIGAVWLFRGLEVPEEVIYIL
jgi:elongation factor 1-gamma